MVDPSYFVATTTSACSCETRVTSNTRATRTRVRETLTERSSADKIISALNTCDRVEPEVCEAPRRGDRGSPARGTAAEAETVRADSGAGTSGRVNRRLRVSGQYTHSVSYFAAAPLRALRPAASCIMYSVSKFRDEQTERLKSIRSSPVEVARVPSLTGSQLASDPRRRRRRVGRIVGAHRE